jgi:peroxiredoxin
MSSLEAGSPAPDFDLPSDGGGRVSLADFRGRSLVLYFYPKDDTSGCTSQAQAFTASAESFAKANTAVVGVSKDSVKSHDKFKAKHGLSITLASDESGEVVERYGAWVEKSMYGRAYMGVDRSTFLIGPDGMIRQVWRKVKVAGHIDAVLKAAAALGSSEPA